MVHEEALVENEMEGGDGEDLSNLRDEQVIILCIMT